MVLSESDKKTVLNAIDQVRPYIVEMHSLEELIFQEIGSSNSLSELKTKLEQQEKELDNQALRADLRIYIARIGRQLK